MKHKNSIQSMIFISLFATLMCIGAWIHFPSVIPATMQTFVVMCALGLLGSKKTFFVLVIYILLGSVGLPVFSGFTGGIGALAGPTAGFIWGFLLGVPAYALSQRYFGKNKCSLYIGYIIYIILHYLPGLLWYCIFTFGGMSLAKLISSFTVTVLPFIIPDAVKMLMAVFTVKRMKKVFGEKLSK